MAEARPDGAKLQATGERWWLRHGVGLFESPAEWAG